MNKLVLELEPLLNHKIQEWTSVVSARNENYNPELKQLWINKVNNLPEEKIKELLLKILKR